MKKYSVVIPTYKGTQKLPIALDSLTRQSIPTSEFEIIIVHDGGSTQDAVDLETIVNRYKCLTIKLIHLPFNLGPAVARNEGVKICSGEIIFFTDDDCEVPALWMESHLDVYHTHPNVSMVGGWYRVPLNKLNKNIFEMWLNLRYESFLSLYKPRLSERPAIFYNPLDFPVSNTANLSLRVHILKAVRFDERFKAAGVEDLEFCTRAERSGYVRYYIPQFVCHHKILTLRSFYRLAKGRALGRYVHHAIRIQSVTRPFDMYYTGPSKYINLVALYSYGVRRHLRSLLLLNFIFCFIDINLLYKASRGFKYRKHLRTLEKWRIAQIATK